MTWLFKVLKNNFATFETTILFCPKCCNHIILSVLLHRGRKNKNNEFLLPGLILFPPEIERVRNIKQLFNNFMFYALADF